MKFCVHCGNEIHDDAVICVKCGRQIENQNQSNKPINNEDDTMSMVVKVFLILGCIAQGWAILPLAWCIPITISVFNGFRDKKPIGMGVKICTLLFVNLVAGICLLCINDEN